jgi:molecular chaperone GrpE (heat shock protein)
MSIYRLTVVHGSVDIVRQGDASQLADVYYIGDPCDIEIIHELINTYWWDSQSSRWDPQSGRSFYGVFTADELQYVLGSKRFAPYRPQLIEGVSTSIFKARDLVEARIRGSIEANKAYDEIDTLRREGPFDHFDAEDLKAAEMRWEEARRFEAERLEAADKARLDKQHSIQRLVNARQEGDQRLQEADEVRREEANRIEAKRPETADEVRQEKANRIEQAAMRGLPTDSGPIAGLDAKMNQISNQLIALSDLFHTRIEDDSTKGQLFEQLHQDLVRYRDDFVFNNITRRVFTDIVGLFDRVDTATNDVTIQSLTRDDLIAHVKSFGNEILQLLRRQEVFAVETIPGKFDEAWQEAIEAKSVENSEDDQKVLQIARKGFTYRGRILRPASVIVARHTPLKEEQSNG